MICTVIQNRDLKGIEAVLEHCEMAEIRLDRCSLSLEEIVSCFGSDVPLVATCRLSEVLEKEFPEDGTPMESRLIKASRVVEERLVKAIESGANFVDVELEMPKHVSKRIRQAAHENGTVFIRSFHDFNGTDSTPSLMALIEKCHYHGADMVKLVTAASCKEDVDRVMGLYDAVKESGLLRDGELVAFCMGEAGVESRIDALAHGAPFTYASVAAGEESACGQLPYQEMAEKVYGNFRFSDFYIDTPASKSFAQRAIVAAALASGTSHLTGYTPCADSEAAIGFAKALGAKVVVEEGRIAVEGIGAGLGLLDIPEVSVGESGLLARLAIPILCQLDTGKVRIDGKGTLLTRSMAGISDMMAAFDAEVKSVAEDAEELTVPLVAGGRLKNGRVDISGKNGSQLVSGLLMALPLSEKNTTVAVKEPKSIPYMFITLDVLRKFGIRIANDMLGGRDFLESGGDWSLCSEMVFKVRGGQRYRAADFPIEGDWSAAANFLVAGAVFGKAELSGLDTTSLQADLSVMDVLMEAGASLSQMDGDKGNVSVQRAPLQAFTLDASNCPDLFPIISVLAAFCQGESRIGGVNRLAHKECDRAEAIVEMLEKFGVSVRLEGDEMVIEGMSLAQRLLTGKLLSGGNFSAHHDHRMAMALKVASLGASGAVVIDDEACVAKSYPAFWNQFV